MKIPSATCHADKHLTASACGMVNVFFGAAPYLTEKHIVIEFCKFWRELA